MDDIQVFAKNESKLETWIQTIGIYNMYIRIEFDMLKRRKRGRTEGIEMSNQEGIRSLVEKENYKYWGILEADTIKQAEVKERIRKE